jgi:hypothetical protein
VYTRASTLLSWVALWALGFVRASVRALMEDCGSGSSLALGGVAAVLSVLRTLSRSGLINTTSTTFLCDNESAVLSTNRPLTDSIFHRIEGDHDLVSTIKDLQENWCRGMDITYEWVKGHADDLNRELTRAEQLSVIADEQCDVVRLHASGTRSARSSKGLWDS